MNRSSRILALILGVGMLFSIYRLFTGTGGSGLGDFFDGLGYTSLVLFAISFVILLINRKRIKRHLDTFVFLILGLPLTLMAAGNFIKHNRQNKEPNLTAKYLRPVSQAQYLQDSINIKEAIDSTIARYNRETGGPKKLSGFVDTIIYSEQGNRVFVSYAERFEPNDRGNDLDPAFLFSEYRESGAWSLQTTNYNLSGSFHDTASLKDAVRKFYLNRFSFLDKDSLDKNFFWRRIVYPGA